jgi:putative long chain acyl-CoA synthase
VIAKTLKRLRRRLRASSRNMLEIARLGRLGEEHGAPYEIVDQGEHHRLRRYAMPAGASTEGPVALFVPPLMVTAEIYDISADTSAVDALAAQGVLPFVVDFGSPENEPGGLRRTLEDHIHAVVRSIERVRALTGRDVHLLGYSQGGMFAYQAAAYLRSAGIRSIVTFGSPVDIHRQLPAVHSDITGALVRGIEPVANYVLDRIDSLPGALTSTGFKLLSPRKEIQARVEFVTKLHDRNALVRREARRRFLGGEGFVAWPGPALRVFFEEFIVHNRMLRGGFVLFGRTVSLADITCPILAFVGGADEIARPATVRAITRAAPDAPVDFVTIPAGHFGLVVGSRAMQTTWPTVAQWIHHREGAGPLPDALREPPNESLDDEYELGDLDIDLELFFDTLIRSAKGGARRVSDALGSAADLVSAVRYQEPRLRRLAALDGDTRVSPALSLAEAAARTPDATFFMFRDRAFSYRDADGRVHTVVRGLHACGVRPGDRVAVIMGSRPSFLSVVTALNRMGAIAVVVPPEVAPESIRGALQDVSRVVADPDIAERFRAVLDREILVLGGGGKSRSLAHGLVDMEAIDPAKVELPADFAENSGRARDLSLVLLRPSDSGELRAVPITNHRWALSAIGAAAACTLTPDDTVFCAIPLHHPTGILVSVGAALVAGARLALVERFSAPTFAESVRRTGATVVFYAGEMLRSLLFERPSAGDRTLPVRLFAGSGMRGDLVAKLRERFGIGVMEFYAGTTQRAILANASGEKPGALGRPLPGSSEIRVVRVDLEKRAPLRDGRGYLVSATRGEPGLLVSRATEDDPPGRVIENAFVDGDRWFASNDVVRRDEDGDFWFVDSLAGFVSTKGGPVSTRSIEDALYALPEVELASVSSTEGELVARIRAREPLDAARVDEALSKLPEKPRIVQVDDIPLTDGFRPRRS